MLASCLELFVKMNIITADKNIRWSDDKCHGTVINSFRLFIITPSEIYWETVSFYLCCCNNIVLFISKSQKKGQDSICNEQVITEDRMHAANSISSSAAGEAVEESLRTSCH